MSWKLIVQAPRQAVLAALAAHEARDDWDPAIVVTGSEVADDRPDEWRLEAYLEHQPGDAERQAISALFSGEAPAITAERLPDADWVTASQQSAPPVRAGRFHVHTPDHPADTAPGTIDFTIPAAQAFGTGQHATTAGCLAMLERMKRRGTVARNLADIGSGTGLLAFAALALWPRAHAIASDIDPLCLPAMRDNAAGNAVPLGAGPGQLATVCAEGMDDPLLWSRAPYDLVIANILAGPLIALAGDFAQAVAPRGSVLLAGLLETQEAAVRAAYRTAGFRLAERAVHGDWSILWLRRRPSFV